MRAPVLRRERMQTGTSRQVKNANADVSENCLRDFRRCLPMRTLLAELPLDIRLRMTRRRVGEAGLMERVRLDLRHGKESKLLWTSGIVGNWYRSNRRW